MSKDDPINKMNGSNLADKSGALQIFFIIYIKNEWLRLFNLLSKKRRRYTK